jgi:nicotinate-nucleotide--dimethylbenzimidazole phosphoribosyltransferase
MFCRQNGFELKLVDIGVDYDLSDNPEIINHKIANGTKNFLYEPAMTEEQIEKAINIGAAMTDECISEGCNVICIGEMGIANTSPSSIWMSIFGNIPLEECIGAGAGLSNEGIKHKYNILKTSIEKFNTSHHDTIDTIRYFGGFEMVGAIGSMLRAAEKHVLILIDGFIMTNCALAATKLYPEVYEYFIFAHQGDEAGHKLVLDYLNAKPLLFFDLRLGEGTGALCAYPLVDSAVRMINEMSTFKHAKVTKYFE